MYFLQVIAAPFAAGALFLKPPYAFVSLIPSNIIGEMWVGVTLTVVVELVPNTIRSPAIAGYLFVISIIGGNMPLLVPPLKKITSLRTALYILFPGLYLLSSVLFLLTLLSLKRDMRRAQEEDEVIRPLLPETPTSEHPGKKFWNWESDIYNYVITLVCNLTIREQSIFIGLCSKIQTAQGSNQNAAFLHNFQPYNTIYYIQPKAICLIRSLFYGPGHGGSRFFQLFYHASLDVWFKLLHAI